MSFWRLTISQACDLDERANNAILGISNMSKLPARLILQRLIETIHTPIGHLMWSVVECDYSYCAHPSQMPTHEMSNVLESLHSIHASRIWIIPSIQDLRSQFAFCIHAHQPIPLPHQSNTDSHRMPRILPNDVPIGRM